jgi:hypothetical protein
MKFRVLLYQDAVAKPAGIPDIWPAEVATVDDDAVVDSPYLLMTPQEYDDYRALHRSAYDAWVDATSLSTIKAAKFAAIDERTVDLIRRGFEFPPGSGQRFSLSNEAQSLLLGAYQSRNDPLFTYPISWNTLDDSGVLEIPDAETLHLFYLQATGTVRARRDSGTALKSQVRAATTTAEVAAVEDTRQ